MSNPQHLERLMKKVTAWNQWRMRTIRQWRMRTVREAADQKAGRTRPDLISGANLRQAILGQAKLIEADLSGANLRRANLIGANLSWTNLRQANLGEANLGGADLGGGPLLGNIGRDGSRRSRSHFVFSVWNLCVGRK
jgi:hypothetical protein